MNNINDKQIRLSQRLGFGLIACVLSLSLVACSSSPNRDSASNKQAKAAVGGMIAGGVIGYATMGSGSGRILAGVAMGGMGAYVGVSLADRLNKWDRQALRDATFQSLATASTGEPTYWQSEYNSNHGQIIPMRTYLDAGGRLCRDYKASVKIEGNEHNGLETACLTNSGSWIVYPSAS